MLMCMHPIMAGKVHEYGLTFSGSMYEDMICDKTKHANEIVSLRH